MIDLLPLPLDAKRLQRELGVTRAVAVPAGPCRRGGLRVRSRRLRRRRSQRPASLFGRDGAADRLTTEPDPPTAPTGARNSARRHRRRSDSGSRAADHRARLHGRRDGDDDSAYRARHDEHRPHGHRGSRAAVRRQGVAGLAGPRDAAAQDEETTTRPEATPETNADANGTETVAAEPTSSETRTPWGWIVLAVGLVLTAGDRRHRGVETATASTESG
jgi:hypothetical protein